MNVERLGTLAKFLRAVPPERFNMDTWVEKSTDNGKVACGYAACAMGWACMIPEFRKDGLKLYGVEPEYNNETGFEVAMEFFDISYENAEYLFSPETYDDNVETKEVIQRIDDIINEQNVG